MQSRQVEFYSDGVRLEGFILTPDRGAADEPRPAVLINSGLFGLKEWVPSRWWPQFLEAGFTCMAFDYRGFGTSDGERGRIYPEEEIRDVMNAVTFLRAQPEVDPTAMGAMGWGLGGGIALSAAARDPHIAAVASVNGPGDVGRVTRDGVSYTTWFDLQERLEADRVRRVTTGESENIDWRQITHPDGGFDVADRTEHFRRDISALGQSPTPEFTLASAEAYYAFRPELEVASISPRPVLIVHGTHNRYMPIDEARRVYELAREPKTLLEIEGAAHLEWIDLESEYHRPNVGRVVSWFAHALSRKAAPTPAQ